MTAAARAVAHRAARLRRPVVAAARTRLGRRVLTRRAVGATLAVVVAARVGPTVAAARADRAAWGTTVPVLVAARHLEAGEVPEGGAVRTVRWPAGLVPPGALEVATGSPLSRPVAAGVPLVDADLAPVGRTAATARLAADEVGVTLPRGEAPVPLRTGSTVDVVAVTAGDGPALGGRRLVAGATVVAVDRDTVTLGVPRPAAPDVAAAAATGTAVVVLVP